MIGRTLAHYRITAAIGAGGMGEVYRARDARLDREVALKLLPARLAADASLLERFRREAKVVAALNHPHVVTIYSVEEAEGTPFLTMELIEGTSLDRSLAPGGLPLAKVFDIGIALADALAAGHEKGIIHRDVKPANVMLANDGRVKVLDFGLAKLVPGGPKGGRAPGAAPEVAGASQATTEVWQPGHPLTEAGSLLGTMPYMSPEQAGGEAVDARSDIFSLGVVLYEMATGSRPFRGKNSAELISSILRDTPRPVREARRDAPRHLERIIDHCLQKDPDARLQTARDVRNELRSLLREIESGDREIQAAGPVPSPRSSGVSVEAGGASVVRWVGPAAAAVMVVVVSLLASGRARSPPAGPARTSPADGTALLDVDPRSIAVLPFVNMSSEAEQEYFSDGISEELLNLLARIPELKVAARTSSFSFRGKDLEIPEIARRLHVAHVLDGSVRKSGNRVRITVQLIQAADGFHLWSETYDRALDDIFRIQNEIAANVVQELKVTLLGEAPKVRATDARAYALYLQAVQLGRQQSTAEAFANSDALYRQVLDIDPDYAPAWVGMCKNSLNEAVIGLLSHREGFDRAREAVSKALASDPDHAPAHGALGWIAMYGDEDLAGAAREFARALELDPTDLDVLGNAAALLQSLGRTGEALAIREALVRRDPVNVLARYNLAITQLWAGRYAESIDSIHTVLSLSPGRGGAHFTLGVALLLGGDAPGALAEFEQETSGFFRRVGLPMAYHALGRGSESDAALAELIEKDRADAASNIASVYAFREEPDRAFEWLDEAVEQKDSGLAEIASEVLFSNIHSDPRWLPFLRRIGRSPEQLAKIEFAVPLPREPSN